MSTSDLSSTVQGRWYGQGVYHREREDSAGCWIASGILSRMVQLCAHQYWYRYIHSSKKTLNLNTCMYYHHLVASSYLHEVQYVALETKKSQLSIPGLSGSACMRCVPRPLHACRRGPCIYYSSTGRLTSAV